MRLDKVQHLFANFILCKQVTSDKLPLELASLFSSGDSIPERLDIYRNNIVKSLTNSLLATYPLINNLTGEKFASYLMRSFVLENPPERACLAYYGKGLEKFIENFPPAGQLPYLAALARLEWAINMAYYAEDDHSVTPADIEDKLCGDIYNLSLRLRSSVSLTYSKWPLLKIREFCNRYDDKCQDTLNINQPGGAIMVYRPLLEVKVLSIEPSEYNFLKLLQVKKLGEALEELLINHPSFDFNQFLNRHFKLGTFSSLLSE